MRRLPTALLCASALLPGTVACSDDDEPSSSNTTTPESTTTSAPDADGQTVLARGDDVEFVGDDGFAGQTLDINAVEKDGVVSGEFSISDVVFVRIECANTDTDGIVTVGGTVTKGDPTHVGDVGALLAMTIWEGDPDRAALGGDPGNVETCTELLDSFRDDPRTYDFVDVQAGSDIKTA